MTHIIKINSDNRFFIQATAENCDPLISIIIPIRVIRLHQIQAFMNSISEQTYSKKEVIIVNSSENKNLQILLQKYKMPVTVINTMASKSEARNIGAERSYGELIIHLDVDMVLTKDVLAECSHQYQRGYDGLIIPEKIIGCGFLADCRRLEKQCYEGEKTMESVRCVTRKIHEQIEGFDTTTGNIDESAYDAKIQRAHAKICRIERPIIINESIINLRKKFKHGKYGRIYFTKYPEKAKPQFSLLRRSKQYSKLLKKKPIHLFALAILKSLELTAFIIGSIIGATEETIGKKTL
jgi:glycosyltransferase involved in cell wall biosynthesis